MSSTHTCIIQEFPIPEREYYAAAPAGWDRPVRPPAPSHSPAPSRLRRRKPSLLPRLIVMGLALFLVGFLLGRAGAVGDKPSPPPASAARQFSPSSKDDGSVQVRTTPGAAISSGEENKTAAAAQGAAISGGEKKIAAVTAVPGAILSGGEKKTISDVTEEWSLILVNRDHPLPEDFQIPELTQLRNGHAVDSRAYPELQRMMDDCRAAGLEPMICSSFRTWDKQEELFERKVQSCIAEAGSREKAEELAAQWVSRPGTSEHQAGLALDIVDKSYQLLDQDQERTAVQKWLMEHCAEYGFILRYPTEKSGLTGVGYEPWHYRYVGTEAARAIMRQGLCLEEYLEAR